MSPGGGGDQSRRQRWPPFANWVRKKTQEGTEEISKDLERASQLLAQADELIYRNPAAAQLLIAQARALASDARSTALLIRANIIEAGFGRGPDE